MATPGLPQRSPMNLSLMNLSNDYPGAARQGVHPAESGGQQFSQFGDINTTDGTTNLMQGFMQQLLAAGISRQDIAEFFQNPASQAGIKQLIAQIQQEQQRVSGQSGFEKFGGATISGLLQGLGQAQQMGQGTPDRFQMLGPSHYIRTPGQQPMSTVDRLLLAATGGLQGYLGQKDKLQAQDFQTNKLLGGLGVKQAELEQSGAGLTQRQAIADVKAKQTARPYKVGQIRTMKEGDDFIEMEYQKDGSWEEKFRAPRYKPGTTINIGAQVTTRETAKDLAENYQYFKGKFRKDAVDNLKQRLGAFWTELNEDVNLGKSKSAKIVRDNLLRDEYERQVIEKFPNAIKERRTVSGKTVLGWWDENDKLLLNLTVLNLD